MWQRMGRGWDVTKASRAVLKVHPRPLCLAIVSAPILLGPILSGSILSGLAGMARLAPASH